MTALEIIVNLIKKDKIGNDDAITLIKALKDPYASPYINTWPYTNPTPWTTWTTNNSDMQID